MSDEADWKPRPHDHLVEPVFAAVRAPASEARPDRAAPRRSRWLLLLAILLGATLIALVAWRLATARATSASSAYAADWLIAT